MKWEKSAGKESPTLLKNKKQLRWLSEIYRDVGCSVYNIFILPGKKKVKKVGSRVYIFFYLAIFLDLSDPRKWDPYASYENWMERERERVREWVVKMESKKDEGMEDGEKVRGEEQSR